MAKPQKIDISTSTIFRIIFIILILIFLYLILDVIAIFIFALIIASAIAPAVNLLEKIKIPRVVGALAIYIITIGILAFLISLIVPSVASDVKDLSSNLPKYVEDLSIKFESFKDASSRYGNIINQIQNFLSGIGDLMKRAASNVFSTAINLFGGIFSLLTALVISFYLSVQKRGVERVLTSIVPIKHRDYVLSLWGRSQRKLGRWLQGQLFLGLIVGVLVYIGLYLLNVKFALLLAIIAGILEIFPYIGPVIAAIPAIILAFLQAPVLGLWVFILYVAVQQVENYVIVPLVIGRVVKLNPVAVIMALLIGGKLGGIPGMILAVPLAAIVAEFFRDIIKRKKKI
ncbi:MAG: AI-2E family transporter [Candidatus Portnoybacteria bacterium]|nr:AI-2E family transporter [Candidatus Portnoybacteria bacterium]